METRIVYHTINRPIRRPSPEFLEIARALYAQAMTPEAGAEYLEAIQAERVLEAQRGMVPGDELPGAEIEQVFVVKPARTGARQMAGAGCVLHGALTTWLSRGSAGGETCPHCRGNQIKRRIK